MYWKWRSAMASCCRGKYRRSVARSLLFVCCTACVSSLLVVFLSVQCLEDHREGESIAEEMTRGSSSGRPPRRVISRWTARTWHAFASGGKSGGDTLRWHNTGFTKDRRSLLRVPAWIPPTCRGVWETEGRRWPRIVCFSHGTRSWRNCCSISNFTIQTSSK